MTHTNRQSCSNSQIQEIGLDGVGWIGLADKGLNPVVLSQHYFNAPYFTFTGHPITGMLYEHISMKS
jgi:hypothetical protein